MAVRDLQQCCQRLDGEKVTERKKEAERFTRLIVLPDVIVELDRCSDLRPPRGLTWDAVFKFVQRYMQRETDALKAAASTAFTSTTARSNRHTRSREVATLCKRFVRIANRRGTRLKCSELVRHVLETLSNKFARMQFGSEYIMLLIRDVLSVRRYWCEIPASTWADLQKLCCRLLESKEELDRAILALAVRLLLSACSFQCDTPYQDLPCFSLRALHALRHERSPDVLERTAIAVTAFLRAAGTNDGQRRLLCRVGEESGAALLYVWLNTRPCSSAKRVLWEFFLLQMSTHHPRGARHAHHGAIAGDIAAWHRVLAQLYDAVCSELKEMGGRIRYSGPGRPARSAPSLPPAFADLAAHVCHQLFNSETNVLEMIEAGGSDGGGNSVPTSGDRGHANSRGASGGSNGSLSGTSRRRGSSWDTRDVASKRRRVDLGWEVLRETLLKSQVDGEVLPWLEIMSRLLDRHPDSLPRSELVATVTTLNRLQVFRRRQGDDRTRLSLLCLNQLAKIQPVDVGVEERRVWRTSWSLALRSLPSAPACETRVLALLSTLLQRGLVPPEPDAWRALLTCRPSRCAVELLLRLVSRQMMPAEGGTAAVAALAASWQPGLVLEGSESTSQESAEEAAWTDGDRRDPTLRRSLMTWLLARQSSPSEDDTEQIEPPAILQGDFPPFLVSRALICLTLKDNRAAAQTIFSDTDFSNEDNTYYPRDEGLEQMEELFLLSTFEVSDPEPTLPGRKNATHLSMASIHTGVTTGSKVMTPVRITLEEKVVAFAESLIAGQDVQPVPAACLARGAALLCGLVAGFRLVGADADDAGRKSVLLEKAKLLMRSVGEFVTTNVNKATESHVACAIKSLVVSCASAVDALDSTQDPLGQLASSLFLLTIPACFITDLLGLVKNMDKQVGSTDLFSDDMDTSTTATTSNSSDLEMLGDNLGRGGESCEDGAGSQVGAVPLCVLSDEQLSHADQLALDTTAFLCACARGASVAARVSGTAPQFNPSKLRCDLLTLCSPAQLDFKRAVHVRTYLCLLEKFPSTGGDSFGMDYSSLLTSLRTICSHYRSDQEVCAALLCRLPPLIRALGCTSGSGPDRDLTDARQKLRAALSGFWLLRGKGQCTTAVRAALLTCMATMLEVDARCRWAILEVESTALPIREAFPEFLDDRQHRVRMLAAQALYRLFLQRAGDGLSAEWQPLPPAVQQDSFERVREKVFTCLRTAVKEQGTDQLGDKCVDSEPNGASVLLAALGTVARCSSLCEKQALYAMVQAQLRHGVAITVIAKAVRVVSLALNQANPTCYLESHLGYLLHHWLTDRKTLENFPFQLLECDTVEEFYRKHWLEVVPRLAMRQDFNGVRAASAAMGVDWRDALIHAFPRLFTRVLPLFVEEGKGHPATAGRHERTEAVLVYEFLCRDDCLGKKKIDELVQANLPEVVTELLGTLHEPSTCGEPSDVGHYASELDPAPNPPTFSAYVIRASMEYLGKCHGGVGKSLIGHLARTPDSIQKILLAVGQQVQLATDVHERHRVLMMYRLFIGHLLGELQDGLGGSGAFVLRDVIYTLIHLINNRPNVQDETSGRSFRLCLDLLNVSCRAGVTWRPEALAPHLHAIVAALLPLITWTSPPQQSSSTSSSTSSQKKHGYASDIAKQALALLDFLVIDCQAVEPLSRALSRLDPFPHQQTLEHLRLAQERVKYQHGKLSLLQELEHFLSAGVWQGLAGARVEGVRHLHVQLAQRKEELCGLLAAQQDSLEGGVLIRLVGGLVRMSRTALASPTGAEDTLEAVAACLGELGPVAFSTTALERDTEGQPWSLLTSITSEDPGSITTQWTDMAVALLNDALTDSSVEVRAASSTCLKAVLATRAGAEFWERHAALPETEFLLQILAPFRNPKKKCLELPPLPLDGRPSKELESDALWVPDGGSHDLWLKGLTCALIRGGAARCDVLRLLGPICEAKVEACERVLPLLLHDALLGDAEVGGSWMPLISSHLMRALQPPRRSSAQGSSRPTTPMLTAGDASGGHVDPVSVRSVLRAIGYLRRHQRPSSQTPWDNNFWLSLNHLQVAWAAQACGAHFTALLYAEIYAGTHRPQDGSGDFNGRSSHDEDSHKSLLENISETGMDEANISLQDLLLEVYRSIGEPDSLYGCGGGQPVHALARVRTYEHEGEWEKALGAYDLDTALPMGVRQAGILQALQNCGLDLVLQRYLRGLEEELPECSADLEEMRYQAAWQAGQWDREPSSRSEPHSLGYHECLYYCLQALHDREFSSFTQHLAAARVQEMRKLSALSLESVHAVYPALCRLRSLSEMEAAGQRLHSTGPDVDVLAPLQDSWRQQLLLLRETDFRYQEPVLSLRTALHRQAAPESTGVLVDHLTELARLARLAGNARVSERAIQAIRQCPRRPHGVHAWQVEDAEMFWAKQEQGRAMGIMKGLLGTLKAQVAGECAKELLALYAECLGRYGHWLAETCSESPSIILSEYLEKSVSVAERAWGDGSGGSGSDMGEGEGGRVCRAALYLSLARFADAQHRSIVAYMRSAEYENKRALLRKAKEDVTLLQSLKLQPSRYMVKLQRECDLDERELLSLRQDRERFLVEALINYVRCLRSGGAHGEARAFRLVSLWLENSAQRQVNDIMRMGVTDIPPHKFLPLIYQLAARMGTKMAGGEAFHSILQKLILRVTLTHPHHALLVVLALANAGKDELLQTVAARDGARGGSRLSRGDSKGSSAPSDDDRVRATRALVEQVRKQQPELVRDMEKLCDAYIMLANMNAEAWRKQTKDMLIPKDQPIKEIRNLYKVVIPTLELKVDPTGQYPDLVTVRAFRPHFRLAGGVNLPKIIDCEGSDGRTYRQLVKGRDDLRQDAVMQQVFHMCNELLAGSTETRTRKLSIRTYKVVPLSQRSGVLEWCVGTMPIGDYLVQKDTGAHTKYRPNDWPSMHCRKFMNDRRNGDLFLAYQELCHHFRPVFRHFFWERFLDPAVWFERRLSYTRSVATSSIVGYIVGLGDRHVQNILIDLNSAELVHIDLGVAFEQGRILPTPETVPFRLTRDIVDGMGITGVEGVFRRCCEKTMEVMRNSQEALLTIVEVLLFDPLFDWTMNPLKALTLQTRAEDETEGTSTMGPTLGKAPESGRAVHQKRNGMDPQSLNKMAERVLMRLQQKLKGVEEGSVLSVPGQVNLLIQQATDPKNLSRLFPGWQPWV